MPLTPDNPDATAWAERGLDAARRMAGLLHERVATVDDAAAKEASLLPGWTRGHVITHLARNADGLVNLLTWARTGVEHPMYTSDADRDAAIDEGAYRMSRVLREDVAAAEQRFFAAADELPAAAWSATITTRRGTELPAHRIPWLRMSEVTIHLVDLGCGDGFDTVLPKLGESTGELIDHIVNMFGGRQLPAVTLDVTMPDDGNRRWSFGDGEPVTVSGPAHAAVGWLTGRADGAGLAGNVPTLPRWL